MYPAFDGLFDADVAVTRALGFDISQRGEALLQRPSRRHRRPRRTQGQRLLQDVGVVSASAGSSPCRKM